MNNLSRHAHSVGARGTTWNLRQRLGRRRRGVALIELALVLPVVLALLLNMIQYGRLAHATEIVTNLAREGARFGSQGAATRDEDIKKYVLDQAATSYLGRDDVLVSVVPAQGTLGRKMGSPITVSVSYDLSKRLFIPAGWMVERYKSNPVKNGTPMYSSAAEMRILDDSQTPMPTPASTPRPTPLPTPAPPQPTSTPVPTSPPQPTATPAPTSPPISPVDSPPSPVDAPPAETPPSAPEPTATPQPTPLPGS